MEKETIRGIIDADSHPRMALAGRRSAGRVSADAGNNLIDADARQEKRHAIVPHNERGVIVA